MRISFHAYDIITHLPIVEVFCQHPLSLSLFLSLFSTQLCRQSDNPEHSIKGPLIDTRSVQETQHAYKSILLFSHWRAGPVLPGIHYLTYQATPF